MSNEVGGSFYYPQAAVSMRLRLEDFGDKSAGLSNEPFRLKCLARRVTVTINDYTQADKFEIEIDYKNFPFDPRCIRACGIVIAIEDSGKIFTDTNSLNPLEITEENTVFTGFADEESITFNEDTRVVKMEGRDMTALLIDRKYLEGSLAVDKPVDQVILGLLQQIDETKDLSIELRGVSELPVLASFYSDKSPMSGHRNVPKEQSYWDLIQRIVVEAGLIAFIELDKLVITRPRVLYDRNQAKKFIYGKNIINLEFKRKIGRKKGFNVAVRCLNIETKEVLTALIPKEASAEWSKDTGIANTEVKIPKMVPASGPANIQDPKRAQQNQLSDTDAEAQGDPAPYISFRVSNITSKQQLIEVGQSIYEEMSRQQIEGSFSTREMKTKFTRLDGKEELFDILKLRNGTPIIIEISNDDIAAIQRIKSITGIEKYLVDKKYDRRVARALSQSIGKSNTPFYTKSVEFTMDSEQGFDCKIEFINFIETTNPAFKETQ